MREHTRERVDNDERSADGVRGTDAAHHTDVVIVGGGPAGLSCALWLARYRRSVVLLDTGDPRNRPAWGVHGYPGLTDPPPLELRARIREQAISAGADCRRGEVVRVTGEKGAFDVALDSGESIGARRVVLAYGLRDFVPELNGIDAFFGHSIYHCPDCDGPAVLGQRVGVYGADRHAAALALYLTTWSDDIVIFTDGDAPSYDDDVAATLQRQKINAVTDRIVRLEGENGLLERVCTSGDPVERDALFFHLGSEPRCPLAGDCGCRHDQHGFIDVDRGQETSVAGIYAAGDICGHPHLASTAAAAGIRAALAIHRSLLPDEFFVGSR